MIALLLSPEIFFRNTIQMLWTLLYECCVLQAVCVHPATSHSNVFSFDYGQNSNCYCLCVFVHSIAQVTVQIGCAMLCCAHLCTFESYSTLQRTLHMGGKFYFGGRKFTSSGALFFLHSPTQKSFLYSSIFSRIVESRGGKTTYTSQVTSARTNTHEHTSNYNIGELKVFHKLLQLLR